MATNIWKFDKNENIERIISFLLTTTGYESGQGYHPILEMAILELMYNVSNEYQINREIIVNVIVKMRKNRLKGADGFEQVFSQDYGQNINNKRVMTRMWVFYLPLYVTLKNEIILPVKLNCLSKEFEIINFKTVENETGKNVRDSDTIKKMTGYRPINRIPKRFLKVVGKGEDIRNAWISDILPAYDTLRGIFEYLFLSDWWKVWVDQPRSILAHPKWMLIVKSSSSSSKKVYGHVFRNEEYPINKMINLSNQNIELLEKYLEIFGERVKKGSIYELLSEILRIYAQAMNERQFYMSFLGLWQAVELITIPDDNKANYDKLRGRLSKYFDGIEGIDFQINSILNIISDKRNDIVHRGIIHEISEVELISLNFICRELIRWMFENADNIRTKLHLNYYYILRDKGDNVLTALKEVVEHIESNRQ